MFLVLTANRYLLYDMQQDAIHKDPAECLDYAMTASFQILSNSYSSDMTPLDTDSTVDWATSQQKQNITSNEQCCSPFSWHFIFKRKAGRSIPVRGCRDSKAPTFSRQLAALHAACLLPPRRFLLLISVRRWVNPRGKVQLEGLGQLRNPVTSLGFEPMTFWFVAWCLNHATARLHVRLLYV
jgi:hypothetical protein